MNQGRPYCISYHIISKLVLSVSLLQSSAITVDAQVGDSAKHQQKLMLTMIKIIHSKSIPNPTGKSVSMTHQ